MTFIASLFTLVVGVIWRYHSGLPQDAVWALAYPGMTNIAEINCITRDNIMYPWMVRAEEDMKEGGGLL